MNRIEPSLRRMAAGFVGGLLALGLSAPSELGAQRAQVPAIQPGRLELEMTPGGCSSLDLDLQALELALCGELTPNGQSGGSEECRIVFGAGGRLAEPEAAPAFSLAVLAVHPLSGGQAFVAVEPLSFKADYPESLATVCGDFNYTLALTAGAQPLSQLRLLPGASPESPTGLVVGTLALETTVSFVPVGEAAAVLTLPLSLALDLAGRWSVVLAENPALPLALAAGGTNLSLFADGASSFAARPACGQDKRPCSRFCFEATAPRIQMLNAMP